MGAQGRDITVSMVNNDQGKISVRTVATETLYLLPTSSCTIGKYFLEVCMTMDDYHMSGCSIPIALH